MAEEKVRVIVASEYPERQHFLREAIEREEGVFSVGQARDSAAALSLSRHLRPDIAIIDSYLPHFIGLGTIPLSRIGGLDTAQAISEELPNVRVVLLNNLDSKGRGNHGLAGDGIISFFKETKAANIPFTLKQLHRETTSPLVFASVEVKPRFAPGSETLGAIDKVMLFGGISLAAGWLLILTMMFAPVGVPLALVGAVTLFVGLAAKLTISLKRRKHVRNSC